MTTEQIQALQSTAADPAAFAAALGQAVQGEIDNAAGVEDVAAGLKSTLEKKKEELAARNAELTAWGELGADRDAIRARLAAAEKLEAEVAASRAAAEAAEAGTTPAQVDKLVQERAQAAMAASRADWESRLQAADATIQTSKTDHGILIERLLDGAIQHELYKAAPDVDPMLFPHLLTEVRRHVRAKTGLDGGEWWRQGMVELETFDPATGTALEDGQKPLGLSGLVDRKRANDWRIFFKQTGAGGGMSSGVPGDPNRRLGPDASASALLGGVFGS